MILYKGSKSYLEVLYTLVYINNILIFPRVWGRPQESLLYPVTSELQGVMNCDNCGTPIEGFYRCLRHPSFFLGGCVFL